MKEMWHVPAVEYHSAIKSNKIIRFAKTWMDLERSCRVKKNTV